MSRTAVDTGGENPFEAIGRTLVTTATTTASPLDLIEMTYLTNNPDRPGYALSEQGEDTAAAQLGMVQEAVNKGHPLFALLMGKVVKIEAVWPEGIGPDTADPIRPVEEP
jgi:hypothetical protein